MFSNEEDVRKALEFHKSKLGTRYVELFRSSHAEIAAATSRNAR